LNRSGNNDHAEAVAKSGQRKIILAASKTVISCLLALEKFIQILKIIAGFFNVVHNELISFDDKMEDKRKVHYSNLREMCSSIKAGSRDFNGVLPSVRTNFLAIPLERTDENYVDHWLKKQKKIIDENCKQQALQFLRKALKAASGALAEMRKET